MAANGTGSSGTDKVNSLIDDIETDTDHITFPRFHQREDSVIAVPQFHDEYTPTHSRNRSTQQTHTLTHHDTNPLSNSHKKDRAIDTTTTTPAFHHLTTDDASSDTSETSDTLSPSSDTMALSRQNVALAKMDTSGRKYRVYCDGVFDLVCSCYMQIYRMLYIFTLPYSFMMCAYIS